MSRLLDMNNAPSASGSAFLETPLRMKRKFIHNSKSTRVTLSFLQQEVPHAPLRLNGRGLLTQTVVSTRLSQHQTQGHDIIQRGLHASSLETIPKTQ